MNLRVAWEPAHDARLFERARKGHGVLTESSEIDLADDAGLYVEEGDVPRNE
jgi:hypothetical protein